MLFLRHHLPRLAFAQAAADVYSFGIIFNAMYRGCQPFDESEFNGVLHLLRSVEKGRRPHIPDSCPAHLRALMTKCWASDPAARIRYARSHSLESVRTCHFCCSLHSSTSYTTALRASSVT